MSVSLLNPALPATPRLRSVRPDEAARPGVYRLPERIVAELQLDAADTPLVGYLVLVPAGATPSLALAPDVAPIPTSSADGALHTESDLHDEGARDGLLLDTERRTARLDGVPLELTYLEFELLAHLAAHPHRVHTRERLVEAVWGYGHIGDGRTVDVHVARLRRKLGPAYRGRIVTVRRVGYKYAPSAR